MCRIRAVITFVDRHHLLQHILTDYGLHRRFQRQTTHKILVVSTYEEIESATGQHTECQRDQKGLLLYHLLTCLMRYDSAFTSMKSGVRCNVYVTIFVRYIDVQNGQNQPPEFIGMSCNVSIRYLKGIHKGPNATKQVRGMGH